MTSGVAASQPDLVTLGDGLLRVVVDRIDGGRLASLTWDGVELLRRRTSERVNPVWYGCYPMAPFAGRIGHGRFAFDGIDYELETNDPPHALHGNVFARAWEYLGADDGVHAFEIATDERWPFPAHVRSTVAVTESSVTLGLSVASDVRQPAWVGWHPWWVRRVHRAGMPVGSELQIHNAARTMLERVNALPTGARVPVPPGPWDDAFTDLDGPMVLTWPDALRVEMTSDAPWWVIYSEQPDAICVEPQTAPPDAIRLGLAPTVTPGSPVTLTTTWTFTDLRP